MTTAASRHSGAASVGGHSRRISRAATAEPVSGIAAYRLLSHARRYGIDRLRETCAIVTAAVVNLKLNHVVTEKTLITTSQRGFVVSLDEVRTLVDAGYMARAADGFDAYKTRTHGFDWKTREFPNG